MLKAWMKWEEQRFHIIYHLDFMECIQRRDFNVERKQIIRGVIFSLLINGGLPFLVYMLLLGHMSNVMALTIATLIPMFETVVHFLKYRKWDVFAGFMSVGFILGIIAALIGGDERLILIRESFVTGILGLIFLGSLVTR